MLYCLLPTVVLLLAACGEDATPEAQSTNYSDSLIFDAGYHKDYNYMLALVDSFETDGSISSVDANRWRGTAYYRKGQYRTAEFYYKKVMEAKLKTPQDQLSYIKAARRLSELLLVKGDFEGSLQVAMPAVRKMAQTKTGSDIDYAILLNNIGCCQINLGRDEEANASFITARGHYINRWSTDSTGRGFQEAVIGTVYTSLAYINTKRYAESIYWIDRTEMLLDKYREKPDARFEYFDEYTGRIEIMRAVAKLGLGMTDEAAEAYKRFLKTDYSRTPSGRINANDYLMEAKRYAEAADNYYYLDQMLQEHDIVYTLDNIELYLLPKLRANIGAHRRDSVIAFSQKLCDVLDSAIVKSKNDDTAELATIYDTQQKEGQIAQQQADLTRQRWLSTTVALLLIIVFFCIFIFFRHRAAHRLSVAHAKLQTAYDQLEETTAAKERIESELRIARDIQRSMLPSVFPNHEGLDIYAVMRPAKEVGGDFYSYLMHGDQLYFCIGDVSGKGVPAALSMAEATRLFRTLASQGMMPAEVATRMNAELAENNEQGMFVTMFIGLANLATGKLNYCNCGHNPPIYDDEFLDVIPNAPIGLWPELEYEGQEIADVRNRPFFIYTDGLNEAEDRHQHQFGDERLMSFLKNGHFDNARHVIESIVDEVEKHRNGAEPNDDLTMLCLKFG